MSNEVQNNICRSQTIERLSDRLLETLNFQREKQYRLMELMGKMAVIVDALSRSSGDNPGYC